MRDLFTRPLRQLVRRPAFAICVVATTALCVGANAATFALVRSIVLEPLPYPSASELFAIGARPSIQGGDSLQVAPQAFFQWRARARGAVTVAAYYAGWKVTVVRDRQARRLTAAAVSHDLLAVLGVRVARGRAFSADEEWSGAGTVALLSHELWIHQFNGADMLGREIVLGADGWPLGRQTGSSSGDRFTIVGVLEPGFALPDARVDLLVPLRALGDDRVGGAPLLTVIARAPHRDTRQISVALGAVNTAARSDVAAWAAPLHNIVIGSAPQLLGVLGGAAGIILLLGFANLATLLVLRAIEQSRETAVRVAIGARPVDLLKPHLVEAFILGTLGGAAAIGLAKYVIAETVPLLPASFPRSASIAFDAIVAAVAVVVALVGITLPGVVITLWMPRARTDELLRAGTRSIAPSLTVDRIRRALVVAQLALGIVLVASASLLVGSVRRLLATNVGFDVEHVGAMTLTLPRGIFASPRDRAVFFSQAVERARRLPGVATASAISALPLRDGDEQIRIAASDDQLARADRRPLVSQALALPGYFGTMRIELLAGRDFSAADAANAPTRAVIVNRAFAQTYLRGREAIGARIALGGGLSPQPYEVVGVVGDVRAGTIRRTGEPAVYLCATQATGSTMSVVVRWRGAERPLQLDSVLASMHPFVSPYDAVSMSDVVRRALARERLASGLLSGLSLLALALLGIGVFSLTSSIVRERTRELGLRMALGADATRTLLEVVVRVGRLVGVAVALGAPLAWVASLTLGGLLFGVSASGFGAYAAAIAVVAAVALVASAPALRVVLRLDPAQVLKGD